MVPEVKEAKLQEKMPEEAKPQTDSINFELPISPNRPVPEAKTVPQAKTAPEATIAIGTAASTGTLTTAGTIAGTIVGTATGNTDTAANTEDVEPKDEDCIRIIFISTFLMQVFQIVNGELVKKGTIGQACPGANPNPDYQSVF